MLPSLRLTTLIASLSAILPSTSHTQALCPQALRNHPFARLRNSSHLQDTSLIPLLWNATVTRTLRIDSISRGLTTFRGDYTLNEWYIEPSGIGEQLGRRLATDSSLRSAVAIDLAQSFQAGDVGISEGMAYVAASLYDYWQLPLQPAATFLADPTYSVNARRKAVRALKSYWSTDEFGRAAAEALCSLVGRADGIESIRANADTDLNDILNRDEFQFLEDIVFALEAAEEQGGPPTSAVFALLPKQSVLTALAKRQFGIR